mmetsp:Transcript_51942/g.119485  ORF Transcript_51942/g.119485 Transcript_51942/m.119485 type:complete len:305 (-) Transcript_51942:283-1197(-)
MLSALTLLALSGMPSLAPAFSGCSSLVRSLFGESTLVPMSVASACAPDVVWDDMAEGKPAVGRDAVRALLESKWPRGARLVVDRISDGTRSGGFTWHREAAGVTGYGLRGTTFLELDEQGQIAYVREGCEPLFKPGELTERLLKAVTQGLQANEQTPVYTPRVPEGARDLVKYLWEEAYPGGAKPTEALGLFAENIRYEDFNYESPFLGLAAVTSFVEAFDIPGIEFVPGRISEGERACCFTWAVKVNGQAGPQGISFYELDEAGRVAFIRDIPAPSIKPPPLLMLAAAFDPKLRVFAPRSERP